MKSAIRLAIFLAVLLSQFTPTWGHSSLISGSPTPNEVLKVMPPEVRLEFNESLLVVGAESPNKLEVLDANGAVISGETGVDGPFIFAPINEELFGYFTVRYRVASADGHPISGQYDFAVAGGDGQVIAPAPTAADGDGSSPLSRNSMAMIAVGVIAYFLLRRRK
jgi:methionine-rich copper-binding protein CopC